MSTEISWLIGVSCALLGSVFGAYFGSHLTLKEFKERVKKQKSAFYYEFTIIQNSYSGTIPFLIKEFNKPLNDSYSKSPVIDLSLIDCLSVELAASSELLNSEQRKLIIRIKYQIQLLNETFDKRYVYAHEWLRCGHGKSRLEASELSQKIKYLTAQLLTYMSELIFYTSKLTLEREKFYFGLYTAIDFANVTCALSEIDFEQCFWQNIQKQVSPTKKV